MRTFRSYVAALLVIASLLLALLLTAKHKPVPINAEAFAKKIYAKAREAGVRESLLTYAKRHVSKGEYEQAIRQMISDIEHESMYRRQGLAAESENGCDTTAYDALCDAVDQPLKKLVGRIHDYRWTNRDAAARARLDAFMAD